MKRDILIEIGVEELPALYLKPAADFFQERLSLNIRDRNIEFKDSESFFSPRRLAVLLKGIDKMEKVTTKRIYGPPAENAFDKKGNPTDAAKGFAKSHKRATKELKVGERKGKRFCYLDIDEKPKETKQIIKEIFPTILSEIPFPKKMKWEESGFEFARPIRWLVVLFGKDVIKLKVAGVESSNISFGPRFKGSEKIKIEDASSYVSIMKKNGIIPSYHERKEIVVKGISNALKSSENIIEDPELLDEVVNLVEYPSVFKGSFNKEYLSLPQDVLTTAMREHQRYFSVIDKKGKILPLYIGVTNTMKENIEEIIKNNNNVLTARLDDAKFYWNEDLKKSLEEMINELREVEWHRGLGTLFDKTSRLVNLSIYLCETIKKCDKSVVERGAYLSKVDQVTNMVKDGKEFTKLEGIIGREYALKSKEKREVAVIISDHYLPRSPEDSLPSSVESAIVGICDRIDTLVGNFIIGQIPSGSADPFGLRRCVNGFIRIVDEFKLRFSLSELVKESISQYTSQKSIKMTTEGEEVRKRLRDFVSNRLSTYFSSIGIRYDIADAVFTIHCDDIFEAMSRIRSLNAEKDSKDFEKLVIGQRRVSNILKDVKITKKEVEESLFDNPEEKQLWKSYREKEKEFQEATEKNNYCKSIKTLLSLRPFIDDFFDSCLVMVDDEAKKNNRLALLSQIKALFIRYANFSAIVLEGEREKESKQ